MVKTGGSKQHKFCRNRGDIYKFCRKIGGNL